VNRRENMYVKDIATLARVSDETVKNIIRELYPAKMVSRKATILNRDEANMVMNKIRMPKETGDSIQLTKNLPDGSSQLTKNLPDGSSQLTKNLEVPTKNLQVEVPMQNASALIIQQAVTLAMQAMLPLFREALTAAKALPAPAIEIVQDYYSILGYCRFKNRTITWSEAVKFGKCAKKKSIEMGYPVERIPDERYGFVGSYHINILDKVFEM
jgi:hypothetical protein